MDNFRKINTNPRELLKLNEFNDSLIAFRQIMRSFCFSDKSVTNFKAIEFRSQQINYIQNCDRDANLYKDS